MKKIDRSTDIIVESDGIFLFKNFKIEVSYDEEISDSLEAAKKELERQVLSLRDQVFYDGSTYIKKAFAGRVSFKKGENSGFEFSVDGIIIIHPYFGSFQFSKSISGETVVLYLNAINAHGVDYFIENYKTTLKSFAEKLELALSEETEKFNNSGSSSYSKVALETGRKYLKDLWSILFLVQIHLPIGIENERLMRAFDQIQNMVL